MHPAICALTIIWACGGVKPATLNAAYALSAFGDTYSTQHLLLVVCPRYGVECWEGNPIMKPFQEHGRAWAYTSTYLEVAGTTYLSAKIQRSDSRTWRTIGHIVKFVQIGAHSYGINANISLSRRIKREAHEQNTSRVATGTSTQPSALPVLQGGPIVANGS